MFWIVKGMASIVSIIAFNVLMYCAIQSVMVPLNQQLDAYDHVVAMTEKYNAR